MPAVVAAPATVVTGSRFFGPEFDEHSDGYDGDISDDVPIKKEVRFAAYHEIVDFAVDDTVLFNPYPTPRYDSVTHVFAVDHLTSALQAAYARAAALDLASGHGSIDEDDAYDGDYIDDEYLIPHRVTHWDDDFVYTMVDKPDGLAKYGRPDGLKPAWMQQRRTLLATTR